MQSSSNNASLVRGLTQVNKRGLPASVVGKREIPHRKLHFSCKDHGHGVVLATLCVPQVGGALDIYQEVFLFQDFLKNQVFSNHLIEIC